MQILSAKFITSAADFTGCIGSVPEITVVGRSNVGKSTLINMLTNQAKLARVSKTPGRTRLINFFDINSGSFTLVDLPGYGYSEGGSKAEAAGWAKLIDKYLTNSANLKHVFMLVDIRHDPTALDLMMAKYLYSLRLSFTILATKSDKLARAARLSAVQNLASKLSVGRDDIIPVSSVNKDNKQAILDKIAYILSMDTGDINT